QQKKRARCVYRSRLYCELLEARNAPGSFHHTSNFGLGANTQHRHHHHHHHHYKHHHREHILATGTDAVAKVIWAIQFGGAESDQGPIGITHVMGNEPVSSPMQAPAVSIVTPSSGNLNSRNLNMPLAGQVTSDNFRLAESLNGSNTSVPASSLIGQPL